MKYITTLLSCLLLQTAIAQQTIGLFENDSLAYNGYTLFSPMSTTATYLIDNCGRLINSWEGSNFPTFSAYLLEDGSLLRPSRGLGLPSIVEKYSWEGDLLWSYRYEAKGGLGQHHDIKPMPNGNILILSTEEYTNSEAIQEGRNPVLLDNNLWPEHIVELQPIGTDSAVIVWEWHVWDHLIQEFDSTKANYGVVADHPEKVDINYVGSAVQGAFTDWLHANHIDYNPQLDQIIINLRNFNEFWIIDHSTTTAEAAGSTGGSSGRGGDILYRWGNPEAYKRGTPLDRKLYLQHNTQWISEGLPGAGNILIFNNGNGRPGGSYSSIDELSSVADEFGNYYIPPAGEPYGPADLTWTYADSANFYALRISGAERQPNGNTLICDGFLGRLFEVDNAGEVHWNYVNPIANGTPLSQGDMIFGNTIFTTRRYSEDYPAFENRDLTPGSVLELNPLIAACTIFEEEPVSIHAPFGKYGLRAFPNPASQTVRFEYDSSQLSGNASLEIYSHMGQLIYQKNLHLNDDHINVNLNDCAAGLYFYRIKTVKSSALQKLTIIR